MTAKTRLELTWIGKDNRPRVEPRILIEDERLSHHAATRREGDHFDNVLIHGDNLLALRALEQDFTGKVKCVYIDPPYNTGSAFEHYDDGIEHSLWLSLMRDRLEVVRNLLSVDGAVFIQIDDNEGHYLKVICDEIFGRSNFIATFLWRKVDSPNDNKVAVTPDHEFILAYARDRASIKLRQRPDSSIIESYRGPDENGLYYRDRLLKKNGKNSLRSDRPSMWFPITGPDGIDVWPIHDDAREACWAIGAVNVKRLIEENKIIWKDRGEEGKSVWVPYTREYAPDVPTRPFSTLWVDLPTTRQTKAHQKKLFGAGMEFSTPKPEELIERILQLSTQPGDLVLDSFAGSGTTGAVAHKMGRRWIMAELGDHCETHIVPRLNKVIDGDDPGGITEAVEWKGGGGYRYYRLAPSLMEKDSFGQWVISKEYDAARLAEAMCKHLSFTYAPSDEHYWMHGRSSESDFLYVTTNSLTHEQLKAISEEVGPERSLLICCRAFQGAHAADFQNLTITKIPSAILDRCEWGRDDYSLKIAALPMAVDEPETSPEPSTRKPAGAANQPGLFGSEDAE